MTQFVKFSNELIALQAEIANGMHPKLVLKLGNAHHMSLEERIGIVAAHCGIPVDGVFSEAALNRLYTTLTDHLIERRESAHGIIVVRDTSKFTH